MTYRPRPSWAQAPGPGQESVWDFPRPPACVPSTRHVTVTADGRLVVDTRRAIRVLETSHPPTWYVPPADVDLTALAPSTAGATVCEFKGVAEYLDVVPGADAAPASAGAADGVGVALPALRAVAWRYPRPSRGFESIAGFIAFRAGRLECRVDGMLVVPQPGDFYAGWITPDVVGPFKGSPGSRGW